MMDNLEYRDIFITEANEYLNSLTESTLVLEKDKSDTEAVHTLFRAAHTLKGMAATMGYDGITELAHVMEDVLDGIRGGERSVSRDLVDLVFECIDEMSMLIGKVSSGNEVPVAKVDLLERLKAVAQGGVIKAAVRPAVSADPGLAAPPAEELAAGVLPNLKALRAGVHRSLENHTPVYHAHIGIDRQCSFKGVRAFLVLKNLEKAGEILLTQPDSVRLESGSFDFEFDVWLASKETADELREDITEVLEISSAEIFEFGLEDLPPEENTEERIAEVVPLAKGQPSAAPGLGVVDVQEQTLSAPPALPVSQTPPQTLSAEPSVLEEITPKSIDAIQLPNATSAPPIVAARTPKKSVRVNVERLDRIMNLVGEMVTAKIRMMQISREKGYKNISDTLTQMDHVINELQDEAMAARMVPMDHVFNRFPRMVRDLARDLGKEIDLEVEGREIELDRTILEEMADPLVHLLRNAVDHGFEMPEVRKASGKDMRGLLHLIARREKNQVIIIVEDDGKGIDPAAIKRAAVEKGMLNQEQADQMGRDEAVQLVAMAGFSTVEKVTKTSGRGVGVDAVKTKIESLGGTLRIESELGKGSRFQLRLPLTLAIIQALMVRQGDEIYAIPVNNINEAIELERKDLDIMHKQDVVMIRDEVLQVQRLGRLLKVPGCMETVPDIFTVLVAEVDDRRVGLMVDEVLGQQEIAIKALGSFLKGVRGFGGVTIQGDGSLALILDIPSLL